MNDYEIMWNELKETLEAKIKACDEIINKYNNFDKIHLKGKKSGLKICLDDLLRLEEIFISR